MCVIVFKPTGIDLPSKEELKKCWNRNNDGCGFMYSDGDGVIISKGFMKFKSFYHELELLKKDVNIRKTPLVIHFRLTSHGITSAKYTHPYPISDDINDLESPFLFTDKAICHNGMIDDVKDHKIYSDTFIFVKDILSQFKQINQDIMDFISESTYSKYCYMDKEMVLMSGDFHKVKGVYYSNLYHEDNGTKWKDTGVIYDKNYEVIDVNCENIDLLDDLYDECSEWLTDELLTIYGDYLEGYKLKKEDMKKLENIMEDELKWFNLKRFYEYYYDGW